MHFIYTMLFLVAAIKWGDWRNWREYYPTILFFIGGDLLKNAILYNHRMWEYHETIVGENILFGHLVINLMIMAIEYPATILIYLGKYPRAWWKQLLWHAFWILLYTTIEYLNLHFDLLYHYHGWNMWWSLAFDAVMFSMLRIHHRNPLLAWGFSLIWLIFLWNVFDVPMKTLK